jgi:hypothetical protein
MVQGDDVELRRAGLWKAFDSEVEFFSALTSYAAGGE